MNEVEALTKGMIFEYIRRNHGGKTHKVGVIIGLNDNGTVKIGWSKCRVSEDRFRHVEGIQLAINRAMGLHQDTAVPLCIKRQIRHFASRCLRYFKDAKVLKIPNNY